MVGIGVVLALLLVIARQYEVARFTLVLVPFLGSLVAALAAPQYRFVMGVSLLPVTCAAIFALTLAWDFVAIPEMYYEGVAGAVHGVLGMSPIWGGASVVGAAVGWAVKRRRSTPPNTSFERTREG